MSKINITYHSASTNEELHQILDLQKQNLREALSEGEKQKEGFLTLRHDFEMLKKLNNACAHCIAKDKDRVVGYALSMLQDFKNSIPLLTPMFEEINTALEQQKIKPSYIAMGQICVDKNYRGKGVFRGLYNYMANELKPSFDAIITEVDTKNIRSSKAHKAVGFELLKKHTANGQLWEIIMLKL